VNETICYLNTDLDLTSDDDLTGLANAFDAHGVFPLHVVRSEGGLWHAIFETDNQYEEPKPNIESMIAVVESLPEQFRSVWSGCTRREFNIGYDCGNKPGAFNHGLSSRLLERMSAVDASLRITLYPPEHDKIAEEGAAADVDKPRI
jgi:hypothetical protein